MDFFEHQDRARRNTGRLVVLFALGVLCIMASVYLLLLAVGPLLMGVGGGHAGDASELTYSLDAVRFGWWNPMFLLIAVVGVGAVVGGGSLFKIAQLRRGGAFIAEQLGGRPIGAETADANERRLLNVVEEMAIASGIPAPLVYVMDKENAINAFAAGFTPRDAVIGVTRGTVETLDRDELQGVIAHEFSHILNGDMRLGLRLIGVLNGILLIGLLGNFIFRAFIYAPRTSSRSNREGGGLVVIAVIALGVGLSIIGAVGTFFGTLIKASISRQREFLADASAVQFTRNPGGIGGALKKIGGLRFHSSIRSPNAGEASHMFFAQALTGGMNALFATHPPLRARIKRIEPNWDGLFPDVPTDWAGARPTQRPAPRADDERVAKEALRRAAFAGAVGTAAAATPTTGARRPRPAVDEIGTLTRSGIAYAATLVAAIPETITRAAREPFSARAIVLCLLLDRDPKVRRRQMGVLTEHDDGILREVERLAPQVEAMEPRLRLPLIDIVIASLRALTPQQYETFRARVQRFIEADEKLDLFEWVMLRILKRSLDAQHRGEAKPRVSYYALPRLTDECRVLLSTLAYAGASNEAQANAAYLAGASRLDVAIGPIARPDACGLRALGDVLDKLAQVTPKLKKGILSACAACIGADREVTVREAEVLRGISDNLDCPMPPLLPGQPLI